MSAADTARANYSAARDEVLYRMRLRDYALLIYLAVVGAILGVALGSTANREILLALPFISLGITIIVSQHYVVAATIGQYLANELEPFLRSLSEDAPHWDNSRTFNTYATTSGMLRVFGHGLIILIPCVLALGVTMEHGLHSPFPFGVLWWFGLICMLASILVLRYAYNMRCLMYREREWRK